MSEHKPYTLNELGTFIDHQFSHLSKLFPDLYENHEMLAYAALSKLSEETGELSEAVLKHFSRQRKTKSLEEDPIPKEIADVIIVALLLARQFDIDITEMMRNKIQYLEDRRNSD